MPDISVIIPCYNIDSYIKDAIESILNQSFRNLELILVDDGSTDNTGKICDYYSNTDNRVKVIHKPNGGVNNARNVGLREARGTYITFIDGDDKLKEDTLKPIFSYFSKNDEVDIVQFPEIHININKQIEIWHGYPSQSRLLNSKHGKFRALISRNPIMPGGLAGKVYRKSIFNNISLNEDMRFGEDMFSLNILMDKCRAVFISHYGGYYYCKRNDSATTTPFTPDKALDLSRLKFALFESAIRFKIDSYRWFCDAVAANIDAWNYYGACGELKGRLLKLNEYKTEINNNIDSDYINNRLIIKLALLQSPLFAAKVNKIILKIRRIIRL